MVPRQIAGIQRSMTRNVSGVTGITAALHGHPRIIPAMTQVHAAGGRGAGVAQWQRVGVLAGLAVLLLGACSPVLDWRQVRPEGWRLALSMPCRPASHARSVALAGPPVELVMYACSAADHTFAIASADLGDLARIGPALQALHQAAVANVQGVSDAEVPAAVKGMTPHPDARQWRVKGRLPDGVAVQEQVLVFTHGQRVFQATVVGPRADDALVRPFFDPIEVLN